MDPPSLGRLGNGAADRQSARSFPGNQGAVPAASFVEPPGFAEQLVGVALGFAAIAELDEQLGPDDFDPCSLGHARLTEFRLSDSRNRLGAGEVKRACRHRQPP